MFRLYRPRLSVLFVCTANICRSPMAEGLLRHTLAQQGLQRSIRVDSAGTHASQSGRASDPRAQQVCREIGVDLRKSRARQLKQADFAKYQHILAMDGRNLKWILDTCPAPYRGRVSLLGSWDKLTEVADIPDPYYGSIESFRHVRQQILSALEGLQGILETDAIS